MLPERSVSAEPATRFDAAWLRSRLSGLRPADAADAEGPGGAQAGGTRAAAVLVPIVAAPCMTAPSATGMPARSPMVLLTRRSALLRTHSGQVSFPGGRPDPLDRDLAATALREAQEEIGVDPAHVTLLGCLPRQGTRASNFLITPFVGLLAPEARWTAAPDEVDAIFGLELEVLMDPDAPRRIEDGLRRGTWSWPHPDHDIWGATAAILVELARLLRGDKSG
jgi:8-oxo-dGTP pyrophosphatase MutT (NUDIX family)